MRRGLAGHLTKDIQIPDAPADRRGRGQDRRHRQARGRQRYAQAHPHLSGMVREPRVCRYQRSSPASSKSKTDSRGAESGADPREGRALTDDEVIKVWKAAGKLGTFGQLTRLCLLGGPRRSEPTMLEWSRQILDDRITFDEAWTKMGLHHDVPRTQLIDEVLAAAKHDLAALLLTMLLPVRRRPGGRCRASPRWLRA